MCSSVGSRMKHRCLLYFSALLAFLFLRTFLVCSFFSSHTSTRRLTCRTGRKRASSLTTLSKASSNNGRPIYRVTLLFILVPRLAALHLPLSVQRARACLNWAGYISAGQSCTSWALSRRVIEPVSSRSVRQTDVFFSVCDGISLLFLCSPHSCSNHRSRFHMSVYDGFSRRYEHSRPITSYFRNLIT